MPRGARRAAVREGAARGCESRCPSSTGETTPLWRGMSVFELARMWELHALCSNGRFQLVLSRMVAFGRYTVTMVHSSSAI